MWQAQRASDQVPVNREDAKGAKVGTDFLGYLRGPSRLRGSILVTAEYSGALLAQGHGKGGLKALLELRVRSIDLFGGQCSVGTAIGE